MEETVIVDQLISDIQAGKYDPGDKLPSENEMAELFKVPRMTVRNAYRRLQELGYISARQGKGSFVNDRHRPIPLILSGSESFSRKMRDRGYDYESRNVFCEPVPYNLNIYRFLRVEEGDTVYRIGRLRLVGGCPIALHISYVAESVFRDIRTEGRSITSMFAYYREKGYRRLANTESRLRVVFPGKFERDILCCSVLIPLLVVESGCVDEETGTVLEVSKNLYRSDYFTYVLE